MQIELFRGGDGNALLIYVSQHFYFYERVREKKQFIRGGYRKNDFAIAFLGVGASRNHPSFLTPLNLQYFRHINQVGWPALN